MVLAFNNAGDFAKAVYGDPQHAGSNGAIAMTAPVGNMTGGNKSRKNNKSRKDRKNQNGGKNKSRNSRSRNNRKSRRDRKNKNQNGGK